MAAAQAPRQLFTPLAHGRRRSGDDVTAFDQFLPAFVRTQIHRGVACLRDNARADRSLGQVPGRRGHPRIKVQASVEEVIDVRPPFALAGFVGVADADLLEESATVRVRIFAERRHSLPVTVEHLLRALVTAEGEIAVVVTALGAEVPGLDRAESRNPDRRMRLLDRLRPDVDVTQLGVFAVPGEWFALGPRLDYQVVRFAILVAYRHRVLPVTVIGVHRRADGKARDKPPARDNVRHGQFLGDAGAPALKT